MDTLCVPVNNQALRQQAIVNMREVYAEAAKVLVINEELVKYSADALLYTETFTRITSYVPSIPHRNTDLPVTGNMKPLDYLPFSLSSILSQLSMLISSF
jgi:hypothetical protein